MNDNNIKKAHQNRSNKNQKTSKHLLNTCWRLLPRNTKRHEKLLTNTKKNQSNPSDINYNQIETTIKIN